MQHTLSSELPVPPADRTGWPWTEELAVNVPPHSGPWPRITIVTPSYNQGAFIEETIRSILLQGYPNLEYIVMDGGSTDETVDVLRKYEFRLDHWESVSDNGQADAINKGLARASGEIFHFINSDDVLSPGALFAVAAAFAEADAVAGAVEVFDEHGAIYTAKPCGLTARNMLNVARHVSYCTYHQPGVWLRRAHVEELGGFDPKFRYCFDSHLFIRYAERWSNITYLDRVVTRFRMHRDSKSVAEIDGFGDEMVSVRRALAFTLRSRNLRAHAKRAAARFRWRNRLETLLAYRSSRTPRRVAACVVPIALRPDITWDREGRWLIRTAVDRATNAARLRLLRLKPGPLPT